jgi:hypothetical protein
MCRSHWRDRHAARCDAVSIDADILELTFVSTLPHLLPESAGDSGVCDAAEPFDGDWTQAPEHQQIRDAALAGDERPTHLFRRRNILVGGSVETTEPARVHRAQRLGLRRNRGVDTQGLGEETPSTPTLGVEGVSESPAAITGATAKPSCRGYFPDA